MEIVLSQLANGLVLGFLYVSIAIGLTIILGLLGIVNFAHGAFFALGAYIALSLYEQFGWGAVIFAPIIVAIIGAIMEALLIRRIYGKDPLRGLILTFALAMGMEAIISYVWGSATRSLPVPGAFAGFVELGPVFITNYRVAVMLAVIAMLLALWAFLIFTPFGRILRAGSRDPEMVSLLGVNLPRVWMATFALGCGLTGAAGVLAAPMWQIMPTMSHGAIMPAFVIVAIGGLGSYAGAVVAGIAVGVVTALTIQFWPAASSAAMYALMVVTLLVRPRGLFGVKWERFE